jgi:putative hydrolase of the HAD superfamily
LAELVDGVVSSATVGAAKPAPVLFEAALAAAGCSAADALHVGDSLSKDVEGASQAGIAAVLLDRNAERPQAPARIESLAELPALI